MRKAKKENSALKIINQGIAMLEYCVQHKATFDNSKQRRRRRDDMRKMREKLQDETPF